MALDRDASTTLELRLVPPSSTGQRAPTSWLLLHTIPITASLSRALSRLLAAQKVAAAKYAAVRDSTANTVDGMSSCTAHGGRVDGSEAVSSEPHLPTDASRSPPWSHALSAAEVQWIAYVRIGYLTSEIHAYCLLIQCNTATQAAYIKDSLEEGAALGVSAPVEYVCETDLVTVTHTVFDQATGGQDGGTESRGEAVEGLPTASSSSLSPGDGAGSTTLLRQWRTSIESCTLVDAVTRVYASSFKAAEEDQYGHGSSSPPPWRAQQSRLRGKGASPSPAMSRPSQVQTPLQQMLPSPQPAAMHMDLLTYSLSPVGCAAGEEDCSICLVDPLWAHSRVMTLCQHTFHLRCYAQLPSGASDCPLCRFSVYDLLNDARCAVCGTYEDLWVCLICGHVACGRARRDHQQEHYQASRHSCAWQSSTNRIWNASSRMFLHQEVALLLDGVDDDKGHDGNAGEYDSHHPSHGNEAGGVVAAASATASGPPEDLMDPMKYLRDVSWAESLDPDLQEALNESKEEAVAQYYTDVLQRLSEEQKRYYDRIIMHQQLQQERKRVAELNKKANDGDILGGVAWTVAGLTLAEQRHRSTIITECIRSTADIFASVRRDLNKLQSSLRDMQNDLQQRVLMQTHFNNGATMRIEQLRQRAREMQAKADVDFAKKKKEESELQEKLSAALALL